MNYYTSLLLWLYCALFVSDTSGGGLTDIIFGETLCISIKVEAFLPSTYRDFLFGATDMVEIFGTQIAGGSGIENTLSAAFVSCGIVVDLSCDFALFLHRFFSRNCLLVLAALVVINWFSGTSLLLLSLLFTPALHSTVT